MSEEYIHVHRPNARSDCASSDTPKKSRRRSASQSRKKTPNRRQQLNETSDIDATASSGDLSNEHILQHVFAAFEQKIELTKQDIHQDLFDSILDNTMQFFNFYMSKRDAYQSDSDDLAFNPVCHVIPTIALFTGINTQDYANMCDNLSDKLREHSTKYLFFVNEKNSNNFKTLVNSLYGQWEVMSDLNQDQMVKRNVFTFRHLFDMIRKTQQNETLNEATPSSHRNDSVIFIFKQFELIPKETIENLVSILSCFVPKIGIHFIIELASQTNIIYEQLSSSVISKLCIKKLYLMSPEQYIDRFIYQLFIDQSTFFKLSGDILKYLTDLYYDYNFSINSLVHELKYCFYEHLLADPVNAIFISSELESFEFYEIIVNNLLNGSDKRTRNYLQQICLDMNDSQISRCTQHMQRNWLQYHNQFVFVAQLLYEIVKSFPVESDDHSLFSDATSTKSFTGFYTRMCHVSAQSSHASARRFVECDQFTNLRKLIALSSAATIQQIAGALHTLIATTVMENQANYQTDFLNDLHEFNETLDKLRKSLDTAQVLERSFAEDELTGGGGDGGAKNGHAEHHAADVAAENNENDCTLDAAVDQAAHQRKKANSSAVSRRSSVRTLKPISENSTTKLSSGKRQSLAPTATSTATPAATSTASAAASAQSQQHMLTQQKAQLAKLTTSLKASLIEWLSTQFSIYFDTDYVTCMPYSKHFCFADMDLMKKRLFDVQRINVHNCLVNSYKYLSLSSLVPISSDSPRKRLKNACNGSSPVSDADMNAPDLLPLNIIYRIYLECGHMINLYDWLQAFVERMENADLKDLNPEKRKLLQSITELQFIGLIKPTNRKVDHVIKLTNGSGLLTLEN